MQQFDPATHSHEARRLAFAMMRSLTPTLATQLKGRVGDEDAFFAMSRQQLVAQTHLRGNVVEDEYRRELLQNATRELEFTRRSSVSTLFYDDDAYPRRLLNCDDAPALLFKLGDDVLDRRHMIAIVGTRNATVQGIEFVNRLVSDIAGKLDDTVIVSGLAYGIDAAAHRAALSANIPTIAVTAHPLNQVYPADHRDLAVKILSSGGAMVTEYPTCNRVHKSNFLARNRIIAGLCDATIVVESDYKGGALMTARIANEYNRQVFAIPGRPTDKYSRGCNKLIANNTAQLLCSADELIEIMNWKASEREHQQEFVFDFTPDQQQLVDLLKENPMSTINDMVVMTGRSVPQLTDTLFTLEMSDIVARCPGGQFALIASV
jgi:DNA processing protein